MKNLTMGPKPSKITLVEPICKFDYPKIPLKPKSPQALKTMVRVLDPMLVNRRSNFHHDSDGDDEFAQSHIGWDRNDVHYKKKPPPPPDQPEIVPPKPKKTK